MSCSCGQGIPTDPGMGASGAHWVQDLLREDAELLAHSQHSGRARPGGEITQGERLESARGCLCWK